MGSIPLQRSFEAQREKREAAVEYSIDREPWRAFRSSLAVEFTSRRSHRWCPDQLSEHVKAEILTGLEARSAIIRSFSRIQSMVRDAVANEKFAASHGDRLSPYRADDKEVFDYARKLAGVGGPRSAHGDMLTDLFDRLEVAFDAVRLIVHGFVEVREERSGKVLFRVKQWGRRHTFTTQQLQAQAISLELLAGNVASSLLTASAQL